VLEEHPRRLLFVFIAIVGACVGGYKCSQWRLHVFASELQIFTL
jgi:hypothetical protein